MGTYGVASLWQPLQFVATGCCAFQWQLKHDEWFVGDALKVVVRDAWQMVQLL